MPEITPLTPQQIALIQSNYKALADTSSELADTFYTRLFEIAPETKPLFKETDMKSQGTKLVQIVGVAVGSLAQPSLLVPALTALGQRHAGYGVSNAMYQPVGEALLWTLEQLLGDAFTEETRAAWTTLYVFLAETSISASKESENE